MSLLGSLPRDQRGPVAQCLQAAEAAYQLHPHPLPAKIHPRLWEAYSRGRLHYAAMGVHELAEFKCPVLLEDPRHATHSLNNAFTDLRLRLYAALLIPPPPEVRSAKGKKKAAAAAAAGAPGPADAAHTVVEYIQSERRYKARKVAAPEPAATLATELLAPALPADQRVVALMSLFLPDCAPLRSLPPPLLPAGLIARYLLVNTTHPQLQLAQAEWRVIVATLLALRLHTPLPDAAAEFEPPPERRCVHVANLAQLAWWYLSLANDVCGQPLALGPAYNAFHGPLWLHCWHRAAEALPAFCLQDADLLTAFNTVVAAATAELPPYAWREPSAARAPRAEAEAKAKQARAPAAASVPLPGGNKFALLGDADE